MAAAGWAAGIDGMEEDSQAAWANLLSKGSWNRGQLYCAMGGGTVSPIDESPVCSPEDFYITTLGRRLGPGVGGGGGAQRHCK